MVEGLRVNDEKSPPQYLQPTATVLKTNRTGSFSATFRQGQWLEANAVLCLYAGTETIAASGSGPNPIT
jgi:hypothetical protein